MDFSLLAFIGICFIAALSGAVFKPGAWYASLRKPWWIPPNYAFPLVWSILYGMIAVSGWLAWGAGQGSALVLAMVVYGLQLLINASWSGAFFGLKRMRLGLVAVIALWLSIALNIAVFWPLSTLAALLLVPYLVWVTIAGYLNWTMIQLNPEAVGAPRGLGA